MKGGSGFVFEVQDLSEESDNSAWFARSHVVRSRTLHDRHAPYCPISAFEEA